jgi:hypothetical protein
MIAVQDIPDSVKARLGDHSLDRLGKYLERRAANCETGRKVCRDMERPWSPPVPLTDSEIMEISYNLDKAGAAEERRERRAAKKAENQRRCEAGKIPNAKISGETPRQDL